MNIKYILAVLATASTLSLLAYLIELSTKLPEPIAYFAITVLAATITLFVTRGGGQAQRRQRAHAAAAGRSPKNEPGKETGSVKWFSASKGFGFITRDNGEDIFVHFRSISGSGHRILREGQRVEFAVSEGTKGLQAEDVIALK